MTDTHAPRSFPYQWEALPLAWTPSFQDSHGWFTWTHERITGKGHLAVVLPDTPGDHWRASFFLSNIHSANRLFSSPERAREAAEWTLTSFYQGQGISPGELAFDRHPKTPEEEIITILTASLEESWKIDHISAYTREWVAVCKKEKQLRNFAFAYDTGGPLAPRQQRGRKDYSLR